MTEAQARALPYLMSIFVGLIVVNVITTTSIYYVSRIKQIKTLAIYWFSVFITFLIQGQFQTGELVIMLSFGLSIVPCLLLSKVLTESLDCKFPIKKYGTFWAVGISLGVLMHSLGVRFSIAALPMCLAQSYCLIEPGLEALIGQRRTSTITQKFVATIFIFGTIHSINFALFRLETGAQFWGWSASLALYQVVTIALFAFAFEEYSKKEKQRLQAIVAERTVELTRTLDIKETLLKVVLHDIANPIQCQLWLIEKHKNLKGETLPDLHKLTRLTQIVTDIINYVRAMKNMKEGSLELELRPIEIEQCLEDLKLVFESSLNKKGIRLVLKNELPPGATFLADHKSFTTSVLSNLISNAIKFSLPKSDLTISTFLKDSKVMIEIEDKGIGISQEMVAGLFNSKRKLSRPGTLGEAGTGHGMQLVKSFIDYFGGEISVESRTQDQYPDNHGTKVTLTMEQTLGH